MYHKYHTEGFILGSVPTSEANKFVSIFTRDLGLVLAHVQSVRSNNSRLRFGLQDFSFSQISLIHGKSGWRVVGSSSIISWFNLCKDNPSKLYVCAYTISFLRKLVRGEEKDEELFNIVYGAMNFLSKESFSYKEIGALQCLIMFRVLYRLGYIGEVLKLDFNDFSWNKDIINFILSNQKIVIQEINKAIKESHL